MTTPGRRDAIGPLALTVGLVMISVLDGSLGWQLFRLVAIVGLGVALTTAVAASTARAGLPCALVGVVATLVGVTIGFTYVSRTGLSARGVGGLVTLAGGVVLLVRAVPVVFRPVHGWRRGVAVAASVAGLAIIGLPVVQAVYATNVPRPALGDDTPGDLGLAYDDVEFTTDDGVELHGWYIPSKNGAAIIVAHGASSTRSAVLDPAVVLARHDYGVLLYDARGHGESEGRAMEFGWYGDADVAAAASFLATRPDVDPDRIGALGMSMGGEEVIGAMAADPRLRAVVAEGATNRTFADKTWLGDVYGVRGGLQRGIDWLTYSLTDLLTDASSPTPLGDAIAAAAPRPVLLIAAGNVSDERHAAAAMQRRATSTVEVWVVPGADHTDGLDTAPAEWEQRVVDFFDRHLQPV